MDPVTVSLSTGRSLAVRTHFGCCFSPTSRSKNTNAMTAISRPRAAPKSKRRVPVERP